MLLFMDHLFEIQENLPHLKIVSGEKNYFLHFHVGKLLKGFKILCRDFEHILKKGGNYSRRDII